jgi:hypothetical protein
VQIAGLSDHVSATSIKPACLDTFFSIRHVDKNKKDPRASVVNVACQNAWVAPSSAKNEVTKHVTIKPLKPMVSNPKILTIVKKTFIR